MEFIENHTLFDIYIERAKRLGPVRTAVVHPVSEEALLGAIEATVAGLITPLLVGPSQKIIALAKSLNIDLSPYQMINTEHSHAAAAHAVVLARTGEVHMLMKGGLHTDELLHAVVKPGKGLTTDRMMSHVFLLDIPNYSKPLILTDAAINIAPDLNAKRDIVQNAIYFSHSMGIEDPKVAILAAVETINMKMQSTIDAAALCKMADRRQIVGGTLDGPLAFDSVISKQAAKIKNIISSVAGQADILVVPNLEAGNMLAKQLEYLSEAHIAGIVLGTRVPIVLTSRADNNEARTASCALAILYAEYHRKLLQKKHAK